MKIAVLSTNKNLYSTKRLVEAIEQKGHEAFVINHTKCHFRMEEGSPQIFHRKKLLSHFDAIIPRIGASVTYLGTAVVRQFEMQGTFSVNSSQSILQSRDKLRSLQLLSKTDVGIPKTVFAKYPKNAEVDMLLNEVGGTPVVIKVLQGTQGLGVVLADTEQSAKSTIEAFSGLKENILIQEFIKEAGGADVRAFVVAGKVVGSMKRQGKEGEFRSNLHRGGKSEVIELSEVEKQTAIKAAKAMDLSMAGVDILLSSRGPLILEVNSSPGLEGIETATKVDIASKIVEHIEQSMAARKNQFTPLQDEEE
ncbi:30S ribosomal protein S6--L-glutamate ligase [Bernardetia sp.]|uniref:30S ribosomal protein S6--L-glutamate ligase n=1 Tax=Bernardetia sp. TaxID=1937974 RepID=UPI0025BACE8F|nr:30S ribosomal protein S6--L-glutamate ligase [Bernardetia sp.]